MPRFVLHYGKWAASLLIFLVGTWLLALILPSSWVTWLIDLGGLPFILLLTLLSTTIALFARPRTLVYPTLLGLLFGLWFGYIAHVVFALDVSSAESPARLILFRFPSLHAIVIFVLLSPLFHLRRSLGGGWLLLGMILMSVRVSADLLSLIDLAGGALIGLGVFCLLDWIEHHHRSFERLQQLLQTQLEVRRQLFHALFGLAVAFLVRWYLLDTIVLLFLVVILLGLIILLKYLQRPRWLYRYLGYFERREHLMRFPARGPFFFVLGSYLVLLIFPLPVALASIVILAVGDSTTNVIGRYFGQKKIWYNTKKHWVGTFSGIALAFFCASLFISPAVALGGAAVGMLVESFPSKWGFLEWDDNLLIPLSAGLAMWLMM